MMLLTGSKATHCTVRPKPPPLLVRCPVVSATRGRVSIKCSTVAFVNSASVDTSPEQDDTVLRSQEADESLDSSNTPTALGSTQSDNLYERYKQKRRRRVEEVNPALKEEEKQRRQRIGQANCGRVPWNKGRKHTPETVAKIRESVKEALIRPAVAAKLKAAAVAKTGVKRAPDSAIRAKISAGVRAAKLRKENESGNTPVTEQERQARRAAARKQRRLAKKAALQAERDAAAKAKQEAEEAEWAALTEEERAARIAAQEEEQRLKREERNRAIAETLRQRWANPEFRQRMEESMRQKARSTFGPPKRGRRKAQAAAAAAELEKLRQRLGVLVKLQAVVQQLEQSRAALQAKMSALANDSEAHRTGERELWEAKQLLEAARAKHDALRRMVPPNIVLGPDGTLQSIQPLPGSPTPLAAAPAPREATVTATAAAGFGGVSAGAAVAVRGEAKAAAGPRAEAAAGMAGDTRIGTGAVAAAGAGARAAEGPGASPGPGHGMVGSGPRFGVGAGTGVGAAERRRVAGLSSFADARPFELVLERAMRESQEDYGEYDGGDEEDDGEDVLVMPDEEEDLEGAVPGMYGLSGPRREGMQWRTGKAPAGAPALPTAAASAAAGSGAAGGSGQGFSNGNVNGKGYGYALRANGTANGAIIDTLYR